MQIHLANCGQSLIRCPNYDCASYVKRTLLESHLIQCSQRVTSPGSSSASSEHLSGIVAVPLVNARDHLSKQTEAVNSLSERLLLLETNITAVRSALNEETRQRYRLIEDVGALRKRNIVSDQWTSKVGEVLTALKKCLNEETASRCVDLQKTNLEVTTLFNQYQVIILLKIRLLITAVTHLLGFNKVAP